MKSIKVREYSGLLGNWNLEAYHYIMLPESYNDNNYKEVRAYNAFFHNPNRVLKRLNSERNFAVDDLDIRDYKVPEFRHLSIFDFFKQIGYDNKKKKFNNA